MTLKLVIDEHPGEKIWTTEKICFQYDAQRNVGILFLGGRVDRELEHLWTIGLDTISTMLNMELTSRSSINQIGKTNE